MKVRELRLVLQTMKQLPDKRLNPIAEAFFVTPPRDYLDTVVMAIAAGEREWRKECQT